MKTGDLVRTQSSMLGIVYEKIRDPKNTVVVVELVEAVANKTHWRFHPKELKVINEGR